ncbi:hypothetical protein APS56_06375 [Pseudalgibacter alginicilyticus]|uniref:N-acetyltransferase domain-containing protein n=1 Tax=Pseudalgibacter alginicilyticus TaxID=1736674 RepID=A0A0P0DAB7_9FLAO|nr:GNAT family N-acetyltransferase [Pseudalgibacter alginicilyticus]ALJ04771.1 hypothetical protein APS56_06375 [Pseudalgibacter alginicilyticus]
MNYIIKQINSKETHDVRHPVLRTGKPIESCIFDGDDLKTTIHLGLFKNEKLIAVASFFKNETKLLNKTNQFQLRGMAVLKKFQGNNLGKLLLEYGESELKKQQTIILWCNARESAINFYKKCDYQIIGKPFNIESIGTHYVMYKTITDKNNVT